MTRGQKYHVTVEQTADGDAYIPLPLELIEDLGWSEGTLVNWSVNDQGHILLTEYKQDPKDKNNS